VPTTYRRTAHRLEELQAAYAAGLDHEQAVADLGLTPGALAKWLERQGELELARPFYRISEAHRRKEAR
jgi:23S rRNA U2552 (ribose-2'-O)-methylase RlmE/FtsJ